MKIIVMAILLLLMTSTPDQASAIERAEELVRKCIADVSNPKEAFDRIHCSSYIGGILDAYSAISDLYPQSKFICLPKQTGISVDQAINIFIRWVKDHPDKHHLPARSAVLISLRDAFPCKKNQ